jgi:hypothetical protein
LDGCDHLPAGWSAAAGGVGNSNVRAVNLVRPAKLNYPTEFNRPP